MTTETLTFVLLTLSLVVLICLASDPQSATDQFLTRHDQSHPVQPLDEALIALNFRHRFDLKQKKFQDEYPTNNDIVPELQVGCGDGLLLETTAASRPRIPEHKKVYARKERKKRQANKGNPTDYFGYTVYTPSAFSYSAWKSQSYIPNWGSPGRLPTYFPPQFIAVNPEFPLDNPPKKGQLPPAIPPTTTTESTTLIELENRFIDDEPSVWNRDPGTSSTTTSTFPPLIHNLNPESGASAISTTRPPRSVAFAPANDFEISYEPEFSAASAPIPSVSRPPATTPCDWAIINCCSASFASFSNTCFERLGCPGPFWDVSPCESNLAHRVRRMSLNYYRTRLN